MTSLKMIEPTLKIVNQTLMNLPSPIFISYLWNFGSMLGIILVSQIISGLLVSMFYVSDLSMSFFSVIHLIRDVSEGWLIRFIHINGASFFFVVLYSHILIRGMYFKSFVINKQTWLSGVSMLLIFIATAFLGYVLPWGQMSFWGATVITNIVSVIPYMGKELTMWIWGGFSVGGATLTRFFSLHFFVPIFSIVLLIIHLIFLHEKGSSSVISSNRVDKILFNFFYSFKDFVTFILFFILILFIRIFFPYLFGDPENFNPANPLSTPIHIQPEWYFLFAYAILRSIPSKLGGATALIFSVIIFYFLIFSRKKGNSIKFYLIEKFIFYFLLVLIILLTWIGANPVEPPLISLGQLFSVFYFLTFTLLL